MKSRRAASQKATREPVERLRSVLLASAAALLLVPASASAGTVMAGTAPGAAAVTFRDNNNAGEVNTLTYSNPVGSTVQLIDTTSPLGDVDGPGGCSVVGNVATCPEFGTNYLSATLSAGGAIPTTENNSLTGLDSLPVSATGGGGVDTITTSGGADSVTGNDGNDVIDGGGGGDVLDGGAIFGSDGADQVAGGEGNDRIQGGSDGDTLMGGGGDDTVFGNVQEPASAAGDGNDQISGGGGDDVLDGQEGADGITGGDGFDELLGRDGADTLDGGANNDTLSGQLGNDTLNSNDGGPDQDDCGGGNDTVNGDSADVVAGDCETVNGASRGGSAGPGGPQGTAGPPGSNGSNGPPGPAGPRGSALFVSFSDSSLRVRRNRRFTVRYVANGPASVALEVRRGSTRVSRATGTSRSGRNTLRLRVASRGAYTLVLTAVSGSEAATDRIPLRVR